MGKARAWGVNPDVSPARGTNALSDLGKLPRISAWSHQLQSGVTKAAGVLAENSIHARTAPGLGCRACPPPVMIWS